MSIDVYSAERSLQHEIGGLRYRIHLIDRIWNQLSRNIDVETRTQVHGEGSPLDDFLFFGGSTVLKQACRERRCSITLSLGRDEYTRCEYTENTCQVFQHKHVWLVGRFTQHSSPPPRISKEPTPGEPLGKAPH